MDILQHPTAGIPHACVTRRAPYQNKTYNSYQSISSINPKTKDIYSKHHRMETHHWIIICGIMHHVQVGITTGCGRVYRVKEMRMVMMMVMLMKTITATMIPLPMALWRHRERGREGLPLVLTPPCPPRWREVLPLVLGLHADDGPSGILLHGLR